MRQSQWLRCCICLCVLVLAAGCNGMSKKKAVAADDSPTEMRADPGYVQWLEKQAMLRSSQDLSRIVSGTTISWISPFTLPRSEALLKEAPVWLHLNPASVLTAGNDPLFKSLLHPEFWRQTERMGFRGLILSPVRESGGIWGYDISGSQALGSDTVQFDFSKYAGTENDFRQLTRAANAAGANMGDTLVPVATGRGADFFLSARAKPEYQGIYCSIEIPYSAWPLLPEVSAQWQAEPLSANATQVLRDQRLLPMPLLRELSDYPLNPYGWAVTGEIRGIDGTKRRFAYLYCGSPERPVLNWNDPAAGARRILSGAIIKEIGTLGVAFTGVSVSAFLGMEPATPEAHDNMDAFIGTAQDAAQVVAQEVRRYGGWSFLQDALPLPILKRLMPTGPDMAIDHAGSVSAQAALITGNATLLRATLETMQALGIDRGRLIHLIQPDGGMDLSLIHLYGEKDDTAKPLRDYYHRVLIEALTAVGGDIFIKRDVLHTTPAGVVGLAAGIREMKNLTPEGKQAVYDGMSALAAYHAMQPGIFMASGRELTGTLPLPQGLVPAQTEDEALRQNMMGAYDLLDTARQSLITPLGMPKATMAFGTIPEQTLTPGSFAWNLHRILLIRNHYGVQFATPLGVLPSQTDATLMQLFRLPDTPEAGGKLLLVATNFSRNEVRESIEAGASPELDGLPESTKLLDLLAEPEDALPINRDAKVLRLRIGPWQTRVILLDTAQQNAASTAR